MSANPADPRSILRRVAERAMHPTTGDKRFHGAIYGAWGLLFLSIVLFAATSNVLWPVLATMVLVAVVVVFLGWCIWDSTQALEAEAAAGIPRTPLTTQDTAGCIAIGMAGLLVVSGGVLLVFLHTLKGPWVNLFVPLALLLGLLCAALWVRLRRFHRRGA